MPTLDSVGDDQDDASATSPPRRLSRRTLSLIIGAIIVLVIGGISVAAYPLVFLAPNNYICLFAGAAGMSIPVFLALNLSGTVFRLWIIQVLGNIFDKPIDAVLGFIQDYRVPLLILSVGLVFFSVW